MAIIPPPNVRVLDEDGRMSQIWYKFFSDLTATNQPIYNSAFIDMTELSAPPAAGAALHARLFTQDNGGGKVQLAARFPTGAVQPIATEP